MLLLLEGIVSASETASLSDLLPRSLQQDSHGDCLQGTLCQGAKPDMALPTLKFCKLPSVLHGCIAADSGAQDFCGYQCAGSESQATLPGEQIWLLPNTFLSDTLCSLKACFIYF